MLTREQASALHPAPAVTESKLTRLRLLAAHRNPKIRESVASSRNTPAGVFADLALDPDDGVRACLARNETAPIEVIRLLAADSAEQVRGWLAVNHSTPADVLDRLAGDESSTVRRLVEWKRAQA